jgi:TetR/AcrR family transcriptional repressor of nem operon
MKVSKAVAAEHERALLEAAGTLYRDRGFGDVGVAEIVAAAGLSHGALYSRFSSKQALQSAAVRDLFDWTAGVVASLPDRAAVLDLYLSRQHRDHPGTGCPLSALSADTARADRTTRSDFAAGLEHLIDAMEALTGDDRPQTIATIATLVGALTLARATGKKKLSDEILTTARQALDAA